MSYHDPVVKLLEQTDRLSDRDPRDEHWDTITSAGVANQFEMECQKLVSRYSKLVMLSATMAVMAQWLGCSTRNHKVASSSPVTAMSSFGDWFTQP